MVLCFFFSGHVTVFAKSLSGQKENAKFRINPATSLIFTLPMNSSLISVFCIFLPKKYQLSES